MNPLKALGDWLSKPKHKPGSRGHARELLAQAYEAYRLARRDRPRENQPHGYSGDSAIQSSHDLMNRRVRDLVRNTSQGKRARSAFQDLVVGTGFQTFSWPFAPREMLQIVTEIESLEDGEMGPRLQFALESDDLFEQWSSDPAQFDTEGRLSRFEMERMAMGEAVTTGNAIIVRTMRSDFDIVPLSYQLIEREQLDESQDRPAAPGQNRIVNGIEFDKDNRAVAYHIYTEHPHEFFGTANHGLVGTSGVIPHSVGSGRVRITADRVIDLCLWDRPSSSVGVSWYDANGQTTWDRWSYCDSEIRSAALDAAFAFAAYLNDGEKYGAWGFDDGTEDDDEFGNRSFKVGHSPVAAVLGKDEKLEMVTSSRPNKDAPPFIGLLDRDTAAGFGLSYFTLTGDYGGANFTSTRGAKLDEDLHIQPLQKWFGVHVALRMRREFNAVAAAMGQFRSLSPAEFLENERTYQRFDAIGNGRDLLDPFKEGEARTGRMRTGISTFKEECAKQNKHWIRVLMQIAIERKVSQLFGVTLDFSKSGAGTTAQQAEEVAEIVSMYGGD
ncbi:MAG: phage portal protein [Planctomycetota bacterium]